MEGRHYACSCVYLHILYVCSHVCRPHLEAPGDVENLPLPLPPSPIFFFLKQDLPTISC